MKKLLLLSFVLCSSILQAQLPTSLIKPVQRVFIFDDYEGSLYINSSLKDASVIDEKSGTFQAKLRYNIYNDAIEYKVNQDLFELDKRVSMNVRIDDDYFYYCNFETTRGQERSGYYILVDLNDSYRIYKRYSLNITEPQKSKAYAPTVPGKLTPELTYYLEEKNMILEIPINKKELLAVFSDKEDGLKSYIKKEKIRLRKEEDLIRLVSRYHALKNMDTSPSRSLLSNRDRNR
ncbi:hypothetical protein [Aquimarina intermedia]|uniref:DUF4468 domain-containing protein n=1 Tax=Aquimarina intermedia TaxID=350814 RepID=A0A5S5C9B4_9FLAO|nr:hypothetical protein [Aquimarina intermedia]TYP76001.1 hypothetical protein BD809_102214 [Aquimarina intermedia]